MSEKIAPIVWTSALATGIGSVDEQHQILVNMLNEANERLTDKTGRDVLLEIIRDLIAYALYHFDEEEELMLAKGYDQDRFDLHAQEHRQFAAKVAQIKQEVVQGKLISRDALLGFLNGWLVNHIMGTDQQFAQHVRGQMAAL